jgi:hypothetical protein
VFTLLSQSLVLAGRSHISRPLSFLSNLLNHLLHLVRTRLSSVDLEFLVVNRSRSSWFLIHSSIRVLLREGLNQVVSISSCLSILMLHELILRLSGLDRSGLLLQLCLVVPLGLG